MSEDTITCSTNVMMELFNEGKIQFTSKYCYDKFLRLHDENWKKERTFEWQTDCDNAIIGRIY